MEKERKARRKSNDSMNTFMIDLHCGESASEREGRERGKKLLLDEASQNSGLVAVDFNSRRERERGKDCNIASE